MTDLEMDIETVENSIETWSYEYRNAQTSDFKRSRWAKQVKNGLAWLAQNAPDHYLLKQDFSDIRVIM